MTSPSKHTPHRAAILAVHQGLFPTLGSLNEVIDLANSKMPITCHNELHSLLMTYHNTMLKQLSH